MWSSPEKGVECIGSRRRHSWQYHFGASWCPVVHVHRWSYCKLAERSCTVPIVFKQFSDYNVPQMSKHRKRINTSLSAQVLQSHSQRLFASLQAGFWDRTCWKTLKTEVEVLARMLQKYANIVSEKRLKMMELHSSPEQVRTIANSMTVQHLAARHTLEQCLQGLSSAVEEAGPDMFLFL